MSSLCTSPRAYVIYTSYQPTTLLRHHHCRRPRSHYCPSLTSWPPPPPMSAFTSWPSSRHLWLSFSSEAAATMCCYSTVVPRFWVGCSVASTLGMLSASMNDRRPSVGQHVWMDEKEYSHKTNLLHIPHDHHLSSSRTTDNLIWNAFTFMINTNIIYACSLVRTANWPSSVCNLTWIL